MPEPLRLEALDHDQLVVLAHEALLAGHLIDRAGMPQLIARFGIEPMTDIAIDEWMGASPTYTRRMQKLLGYDGRDDVATMFKGMQLDIGAPPQFMDFRYRVQDDRHGEFWLAHCGALMDVEPMGEEFVVAMCHAIEDPTFPATACATNPRAKVEPIHRPPRTPADRHPHCHWTVVVDDANEPAVEPAIAGLVAASRAAQLPLATIADASNGGRRDYSGELEDDVPLRSFSDATLRAIIEEVALQGHLLVISFLLAVESRFGPEPVAEIGTKQLAGVGGVTAQRLRAAFDLGDDLLSIASVLELHPAFLPRSYVDFTIEVDEPGDRLVLRLGDCPARNETTAHSWPSLLADASALDTIVWGVNPNARCSVLEPSGADPAWEITIGDEARPEPEAVLLTRFSTGADFVFHYA